MPQLSLLQLQLLMLVEVPLLDSIRALAIRVAVPAALLSKASRLVLSRCMRWLDLQLCRAAWLAPHMVHPNRLLSPLHSALSPAAPVNQDTWSRSVSRSVLLVARVAASSTAHDSCLAQVHERVDARLVAAAYIRAGVCRY